MWRVTNRTCGKSVKHVNSTLLYARAAVFAKFAQTNWDSAKIVIIGKRTRRIIVVTYAGNNEVVDCAARDGLVVLRCREILP